MYVVTALTVEAEPTGTLSNVNANLVLLVAGKIPNVNAKTLTVITLKDATKIVKFRIHSDHTNKPVVIPRMTQTASKHVHLAR